MDSYRNYTSVDYSVHEYSRGHVSYRTPQSGGSGRSTDSIQPQYQNNLFQYHTASPLEQQQQSFGQFPFNQSATWRPAFEISSLTAQPQHVPANGFNTQEIQDLSCPANEAPWSMSVARIPLAPDDFQSFYGAENTPKAYTIAGELVSPCYPQPSYSLARDVFATSPDSGIGSASSTNLGDDMPLDPAFAFTATDGSIYAPNVLFETPESVRSDSRLHASGRSSRQRLPKAIPSACLWCGKDLKNNSEAVKHELQHTKPFKCLEEGCPRKIGFATRNDLQRHRKSVHNGDPEVGKKTGHICRACNPSSAPGPKWWPRLDNFKAHIKRKHPDQDEEKLVAESVAPRPDGAASESGYGSYGRRSLPAEEESYQHELRSPIELSPSRRTSRPGDMALFNTDQYHLDPLAGIGEGQSISDVSGSQPASLGTGKGSDIFSLSMLQDAAFRVDPSESAAQTSAATPSRSVANVHRDQFDKSANILGPADTQWNKSTPLLAERGHIAKRRCSGDAPMDLSSCRNKEKEYQCPYCGKLRERECDLRKHIKRHTRPYGCTFPSCHKGFGSNHDWKRHEQNQHKLQDIWQCELSSDDGTKCAKLFSKEGDVAHHLERKHHLSPHTVEMARHLKEMHIGREGYGRFWCGFCAKLINVGNGSQQKTGADAWAHRCQHIGDHFDKERLRISSWMCIEHNKRKGLVSREEKTKRTRSRKKTKRANYHDDSDLGDDGIPSPSFDYSNTTSASSSCDRASPETRSHKRAFDEADLDAEGDSDPDW